MNALLDAVKDWAGAVAIIAAALVALRKAGPESDSARTGARRAKLELAQMIEAAAEHQVQLIADRLTTAEARIEALEGDLFLVVADLATQIKWHDAGATPPPPRITPAARKVVAKHRTT